ncbi:ABC transporter permease [Prolixibacteraceae bacterium Z1-6]|uniref:ABC transporter permease n=1 Tax=Draconibacterium aestuarii TaxID=2998507 RepID=A0A9X3J5B7_9BACT|nr:ABC transporter permease [Prolixibacteraceae bacterium Z1-6]
MILFNLKLAIRNLLKNRIYSVLIVGGFAIGFATVILIGLYYHNETTVNNDFPNHKNIYRIYDVKMNRCNLNWDLFPVLTNDYASVENACPLDYSCGMKFPVKNDLAQTSTEVEYLLSTTNNFFSLFSVEMEESVSSEPFKDKESVVISREVAQALFGKENPLGQQINVGNYFLGTVSGIFKKLPENSSFQAEVILNSENEKFRMSHTVSNGKRYDPTNLFVMLKNGTGAKAFANELNRSTTLKALDVDSLSLQKLDDIYLSKLTVKSRHAKGNTTLLKIFLAIAVLILLLSSINFLNYSISMQYAKLKEIGISKSNGASRRDLISYTFTEVSLGILIALIISFLITILALPYSEMLFGKTLLVHWHDWLAVLPFFGTAVIFTILLNSLAPIYVLSKFEITEFLSGFKGKRNRRQLGKQALLSFQLIVSIALIAVVMIIFKQLNFVKHSDLGFNREKLVRLDIPYKFERSETLSQEIAKLSFVEESSLSYGCPGMINHKMGSNTGEKSFPVNCIPVDNNFVKTIGVELLEGRNFLGGEKNKACLINEEAFKQFGWDTYEGKKFDNGQDGGYNVVGIIEDFKFESFHQTVEPLALLYTGATDGNVLSARLSPGNIGQQIDQIKQIWETLSPYEPFSFTFYDVFFQSLYEKEERLAGSITLFSIIAIVLTCMGILGQIFLISLNRTKEIGVRKVNGAKVSEILVLLNVDFLTWVVVAFVIATPIAWYATHKWLENFAYQTTLSWWIFALAGLLALGIALLTVSWQSWKAATRNPVEALRYE